MHIFHSLSRAPSFSPLSSLFSLHLSPMVIWLNNRADWPGQADGLSPRFIASGPSGAECGAGHGLADGCGRGGHGPPRAMPPRRCCVCQNRAGVLVPRCLARPNGRPCGNGFCAEHARLVCPWHVTDQPSASLFSDGSARPDYRLVDGEGQELAKGGASLNSRVRQRRASTSHSW